ncbi:hypothetical protein ACFC1R_38650 [Kitasatospora sp. NPDC056138]|uniref:hypothetical protein n=1 Tax=Kitasatospora sp. NPDC056138 TaxID=3345724 RepID=UPI0035E1A10B
MSHAQLASGQPVLCTDGPVTSGLSDRRLCEEATGWPRRATHSPFDTPAHGMPAKFGVLRFPGAMEFHSREGSGDPAGSIACLSSFPVQAPDDPMHEYATLS